MRTSEKPTTTISTPSSWIRRRPDEPPSAMFRFRSKHRSTLMSEMRRRESNSSAYMTSVPSNHRTSAPSIVASFSYPASTGTPWSPQPAPCRASAVMVCMAETHVSGESAEPSDATNRVSVWAVAKTVPESKSTTSCRQRMRPESACVASTNVSTLSCDPSFAAAFSLWSVRSTSCMCTPSLSSLARESTPAAACRARSQNFA
mmetsp:Transcript_15623/g.37729  ORF Transcript_15623/g.37729 Transcript_15623/m.37729 type:complete len:203 (-) Transcript_15623:47-655(-)